MSQLPQNIRVQASLNIRNGQLNYQNQPTAFTAIQVTANGPTPGSVRVSHFGTAVNLSELGSLGGWCRIMNLDNSGQNNFISIGVRDIVNNNTYYLHDLLPGEEYIGRISQLLGNAYGTGSGTHSPGDSAEMFIKADLFPTIVLVEAFDP